jgi:hypothetical protein
MRKFLFSITMMAIIGLVSCSNGKKATGNGSAADSTATENKADSANVGAGSAAEMGEDDESIKDDPTNVEVWDVSVRTFDLDSDPKYEMIIRNSEGKTLTLGERQGFDYPADMLETFGNVWQTDVNFDGYTDVMICLGLMPASDQTFVKYDAWVYDPDDGKFYCQNTFREICNPEVDREERRILSHYIARDGKTRVYSAFYWQKDGNIAQEGETWTVGQ